MPLYIDNADLDRIYTEPKFDLGAETVIDGRTYKFVKYNDGDGNVAGTAGGLVYLVGTATTSVEAWETTMDYDSATVVSILQAVAGVLQAALTNGTYGFVQTKGYGRKDVTTDGNVTAGVRLMAGAANGTVVLHDAGAKADIGVALEADSSTTLAAGKYVLQIP